MDKLFFMSESENKPKPITESEEQNKSYKYNFADRAHLLGAIKFFNYTKGKQSDLLAESILDNMIKFGIGYDIIPEDSKLRNYVPEIKLLETLVENDQFDEYCDSILNEQFEYLSEGKTESEKFEKRLYKNSKREAMISNASLDFKQAKLDKQRTKYTISVSKWLHKNMPELFDENKFKNNSVEKAKHLRDKVKKENNYQLLSVHLQKMRNNSPGTFIASRSMLYSMIEAIRFSLIKRRIGRMRWVLLTKPKYKDYAKHHTEVEAEFIDMPYEDILVTFISFIVDAVELGFDKNNGIVEINNFASLPLKLFRNSASINFISENSKKELIKMFESFKNVFIKVESSKHKNDMLKLDKNK